MSEQDMAPVVVPEAGAHRGSVIWLHGLGADGHDFEPLVPELELAGRGVRVILPHAPRQPVTLNGGMVMRAWYDIYDMTLARIDEAGIRRSVSAVQDLIRAELAQGIDGRRIVLAGFSQGGVIAVQAALSFGLALGGVLSLSSYVALPQALAAEQTPANRHLPVFIGHGDEDSVVPPVLAEQAAGLLASQGHPVEKHTYSMGHSLCAAEIGHVKDWLQDRFH